MKAYISKISFTLCLQIVVLLENCYNYQFIFSNLPTYSNECELKTRVRFCSLKQNKSAFELNGKPTASLKPFHLVTPLPKVLHSSDIHLVLLLHVLAISRVFK